eukprot:2909979-Rhodomonas_salina.2
MHAYALTLSGPQQGCEALAPRPADPTNGLGSAAQHRDMAAASNPGLLSSSFLFFCSDVECPRKSYVREKDPFLPTAMANV